MPTVTLRPNSTVHNTAFTVVDSTAHGATSDDSDATYLRGRTQASDEDVFLGLDDLSIPSDAVIASVRCRVRSRRAADDDTDTYVVVFLVFDGLYDQAGSWPMVSTSFSDFEGPWHSERPDGGTWTQEAVNDLQVRLVHDTSPVDPADSDTAEIYVDVEYNEPPTVTLTAPSGTVTDTSRPTVEADYTDDEDDPLDAGQVVVFDDVDISGTAPDDPDDVDADPVYESGTFDASGTTVEHDIAEALEDGETYRVYVRARQQWSGDDLWSDWDHGTFTLDLDTPAAPDVVLAPDPANGRMLVEVSPGTGGDEDAEWFRIEWDDDGVWRDLRGGADDDRGHPVWFAGDPSTGGTAADWWCPFNVSRDYRVRGYYEEPGGNQIAGPATEVSETLTSSHRWLTDARDPEGVLHTKVHLSSHDRTIKGRDTVHTPAGMNTHVVESEPPLRSDQVTVHSLDSDQHDKLATALTSTRTLLFRDRREAFYFRWVGDRSRSQRSHDGVGVDDWSGTMVEVSRPDPLT